MGARNPRRSLSPYMGTGSTNMGHTLYDCPTEDRGCGRHKLLRIDEDGICTEGLADFCNIYGRTREEQGIFHDFLSKYVSRFRNLKADLLARSARLFRMISLLLILFHRFGY